jgi:predicted RNase H-like HicB family nuclease
MRTFVAVVHKDPETDYGVSFPDFPGCITAGTSMDDAVRMAQEALEFHLDGLREEGRTVPEAGRDLDEVRADREFADAAGYLLVPVETVRKATRVNISIEEGLLARLDRAAAERSMSRSAAIAEAARQWVRS